MKEFELLLTIVVVTFIIVLVLNQFSYLIRIKYSQNLFLERFYAGRFVIKNITETKPFANGICNLTENITFLFNQTNFTNYLRKYKIHYPTQLEMDYINGTVMYKVGGLSMNYIEFRRVCEYNGNLVILKLKI